MDNLNSPVAQKRSFPQSEFLSFWTPTYKKCVCCGCCCPQLCQRSTVSRWRRVIVSWRNLSLTRPTRCGWWLSTTPAALCPARDLTSELVSPHTGAKVTTLKQVCLMKPASIIVISYCYCEGRFNGLVSTVTVQWSFPLKCSMYIFGWPERINFYLLIACCLSGSSISTSDWYRELHCHVGFSHVAVELRKTDPRTELHLGVLPPVRTGGRGAEVGVK